MKKEINGRRVDLDILRIIASFAIILAHGVLIFTSEPRYHVKSTEHYFIADIVYELLRVGTVPLFFVLAGWGSAMALRRRSPGRFLADRAARLLLPLAAGILLIGPFIKYMERLQGRSLGLSGLREMPPLHMPFIEFVLLYWGRLNLMTWSHLWFLGYLFIISIVLLPLLRFCAQRAPSHAVPHPILVFLPGAALAALLMIFGGYWPNLPNLLQDWGSLIFYGGCVALGAMLAAWPGFEARLRLEAPRLLLLAGFGFVCLMLGRDAVLGRMGVGLCAWGLIGAGFGYAGRWAPKPSPMLTWLGESTMALYILHHVPILAIAMLLLPLAIPVFVKLLLIVALASAATLALYAWGVKPFALPRLLLGMEAPARPGKQV